MTDPAKTATQLTDPPARPAASPVALRHRAERLAGKREEKQRRQTHLQQRLAELDELLALAQPVTDALKELGEQLFERELQIVQEKLSVALQDVLEQPIEFRATADFKRGSAVVEFSVSRDGNIEDVQRGTGGSVQNILSVGLRMFALATLPQESHRRFLVLDEQDCWLRAELVPRLAGIVDQAARELGFQVLMISHHDLSLFDRYADRIYRLVPDGSRVLVEQGNPDPVDSQN